MDSLGRDEDGRRPGDFRFAWTLIRVLAEQRGRIDAGARGERASAGPRSRSWRTATRTPTSGRVPLRVAPEARFELGLDVVGARELRPGALPRFLTYVLKGGGQQRARDVLYGHDLDELEVVCDAPMPLQVDGEDLGDVSHGDLRVRAGRNLGAGLSV